MRNITLEQATYLPKWRRPEALLFLMAAIMPIAFSTWSVLLNNFVIDVADFTGVEIGWLHTVREIPGFLAIGVLAILLFVREQSLALVSLILLGVATAITAQFPELRGILTITMLSSIGFHYYEAVNQSLQLQWLSKERAPIVLGQLTAVASATSLIAYVIIAIVWTFFEVSYAMTYGLSGGLTAVVAALAFILYPRFQGDAAQKRSIVLKRRYWLYYVLQFMAGARRQIFVVFAAFMMVEKFGFEVQQITLLFIIK